MVVAAITLGDIFRRDAAFYFVIALGFGAFMENPYWQYENELS